jgi:hypothetical protein
MSIGRSRTAVAAALIAAVLGLASAALSAHWALGGTALLDTVGGDIERWGRQRGPSVVAALWAIVALKTIVAVAALALAGIRGSLTGWVSGRVSRALGWIAAIGLTAYGGVLTLVGLLVQADLVRADHGADRGRWRGTPTCGTRGSCCGASPSP